MQHLRDTFARIDTEQTGIITAKQLKAALQEAKIQIDEKELDQIIDEVDVHHHHQINYTEFLASTMSVHKILTNERLLAMFKQFDADNSGFITYDDISEAMIKLGQKISPDEIKEILKKHAIAKEGQISFDEFKMIFQSSASL